MPIYTYRCEACDHQKDVLQKLSDAPLTQCPSCNKESFKKQLTAAGISTGSADVSSGAPSPCMACPMGHNGPCG
jgi:putative FmdB family regulatory protein